MGVRPLLAALLWGALGNASSVKLSSARAPNFVLVVVDDLGHGDAPFVAKDMAKSSPNILQLASEGVVLTSFYASPECTPSRAMLLTGRYNIRTGLQDSVIHGTEPRGLPLEERLLPEVLRDDYGYATSLIGKWHLGFYQSQYLPRSRGFDQFYGILTGGGNHYTHQTTEVFSVRGNTTRLRTLSGYNLWEDDGPVADQPAASVHTTALYSTRAAREIEGHTFDLQPLFMYLSYQAVHGPMQADAQHLDGSIDNGCKELFGATYLDVDEDINYASRPRLCGMLSMIDVGVGKIRDALVARGQWEDTVLVVASDNGGVKRHGSSNAPYKGEKGLYFEGGVRVPALVAGGRTQSALVANGVAPGRECGELFHITDLFATFLGLASSNNARPRDQHRLDGIDQWQTLVAAAPSSRVEVLVNVNSALWGGGGALRIGKYKLLVENSVGDSVLYNAGRAFMQDSLLTSPVLSELVTARREEVFPSPNYYLFDLDANPSEDDTGTCADKVACSNLWDDPDFSEVRAELEARWTFFADQMVSSNENWMDDGPLADPAIFDGTWGPWRDDQGMPLAMYAVV